MNWNLIRLLLSVCAVLLLVLLLEWWLAGVSEREPGDGPGQPRDADLRVELPEIKPTAMAAEMYTDMVERPLFIEGRRPVIEEDEDESVQEVDSVDDLELIGIYTDDKRLMALFSKKGREKKFLKKARGDDLGNWVLEEVSDDSVVLEKDGRRQTLLLRKPKLQPTPVPQPAQTQAKPKARDEAQARAQAEARARAQFEAQQQNEEAQAEARERDEARARAEAAAKAQRR